MVTFVPSRLAGQCDPDGIWLELQAYTNSEAIMLSRGGCVRGLVLRAPLERVVDTLQIAAADSAGWVLTWNGTIWVGAPPTGGGGGGTTETFTNSSDATSHTVTLTPGTTSFTIAEGTGIGIATTGSADNGIATLTNTAPDQTVNIIGAGINVVTGTYPNFTVTGTEVDGSITNEGIIGVSAGGGNDALLTSNTSTANGVTVEGGGIVAVTESTSANGGTITITATEVDGSVTNEAWTIDADGGDTELITDQTVLIAGAGIVTTSYNAAGNTLTITGTEVDGSTTNELQTLANTSDATSHTVTLSSSGGSVQLIEGANITLTTGGTGLDGTVTIASTATGGTNYQTWRDDGTPATARLNANFVSTSDIAFTLTDDAGNTETEVTADIPLGAVDLDEIQDISTSVVLGNSNVSPGHPIELTPDGGLEISGTDLQIADGGVTDIKFRQSAALSVVGNPTNLTGTVVDITAANDGEVLRRSGTALAFGAIDLTSSNALSGILPVTFGGTGVNNIPVNRIPYGDGANPLQHSGNLTFDGDLLTVTGRESILGTASFSADGNFLTISGTATSLANGVDVSGISAAVVAENDGTPTSNSFRGGTFTLSTNTTTSGILYGQNMTVTNTSPNITQMYALTGRVDENSASGSLSNRYGLDFSVFKGAQDATDAHNGVGIRARVLESTSTGRWSSGTGISVSVEDALSSFGILINQTNATGTANAQTGIQISNTSTGSGTVVSTAYGLRLLHSEPSSGSITNYYGIFSSSAPVATNTYFLYNSTAFRNYLNGNLAIGVDNTGAKLFVRGDGATSGTMAATFENSSGSDILNLRNDQRVGIITSTPNRTLEVQGEVRITDLTTDTPTRIVGADAEGDLDTVGIGAENELHITGGSLGTNFHTTISPSILTAGMTNNWNPTGLSTAWIIRVTGDDEFQMITGITAPSFNKRLTIHNVGSNAILLPTENQSSTAANRFSFGRDIVLFSGKTVEIMYDVTTSRWRLMSKAGLYDDVEQAYINKTFSAPVSTTTADYDFWEITSAAAASFVAPIDGLLSGVSVNTSTSSTGFGAVHSKEQFVSLNTTGGSATWGYVKAKIVTPSSLSNGTQNYTIRVGFLDAPGQSDTAEGAYLYYNHGVNSGAWSGYTQNAGNSQVSNSGVTVSASTIYVLEVVYRPNISAEFFINGTRVGTNDTFVPDGDAMYVVAEIEKQGGTTQRDLSVHLLQTSVATVQ